MGPEVISILLALAITLVIAFPLGTALRKYSGAFYVIAAVCTGIYIWTIFGDVNTSQVRWATFMFQKGYLGSFFLALVMYCGALSDGNSIKKKLLPIRGELSILSFILYLGHITTYLKSYLPMFANFGALKGNLAVSLCIALVLTVIFVVLGVTSFKFIRTKMNPTVWKNLQRFAYLMVALLLAHVCLALGLSLANLGSKGSIHVIVYIILIVGYAVLRIMKYSNDKKNAA